MTEATLKQLSKAYETAEMAKKQLEEALAKYVEAMIFHVDALRTHNKTD